MADELQDPAADEERREPDPAGGGAERGDALTGPEKRAEDEHHGEAEREIEREVISEHDGREDHAGADAIDAQPSERNEERQHDHRHADEMRRLVARILALRAIYGHLILH